MPSIKVVPPGDNSREGYSAVQKAFGPGSTGPLQIVAPNHCEQNCLELALAYDEATRWVEKRPPALLGLG